MGAACVERLWRACWRISGVLVNITSQSNRLPGLTADTMMPRHCTKRIVPFHSEIPVQPQMMVQSPA